MRLNAQELSRVPEVVGRIRAQGERFSRTFSWLIRESVKVTPQLWRKMFLATAISLIANAAVVGLIFAYVRMVENDRQLSLFGFTLYARESLLMLALAVIALLFVSLLFAVSQYIARSSAISAMGAIEKHCTIRAIALYRLLPDPRAQRADEILRTTKPLHLAKTYSTHCGMAVKFIGFAVQSLMMSLFALGLMFFFDPKTTLIICGLGLIVIAAQYPSNLFAAKSTAIYTETLPRVQEGLLSLLQRASAQPRHLDPGELHRDLSGFYMKRVPKRNMQATEDRFRSIELSGLTMQFGGSLILGGMILAFGVTAIQSEVDWANLVAYLMLLRLALSNVTSLFRTVTMVARMYPSIQEYADFTLSASRAEAPLPALSPSLGPEPIRLSAKNVEDGSDGVTLEPGTRYAVTAPVAYGRDLAADFQRALGFASMPPANYQHLVSVDIALPPPQGNGAKTIRDWVTATSRQGKIASALARLAQSCANVILVDRHLVDAMSDEQRRNWSETLRDRCLIVVYTDRRRPVADLGEQIAFVRDQFGALQWAAVPDKGFSEREKPWLWGAKSMSSGTQFRSDDAALLE